MKVQLPDLFTETSLYYQCLTLTGWLNYESRVRRFLHQIFSPVWSIGNIESLPQIEPFEAPILAETSYEMPNFIPQIRPKSDTNASVSDLEISLTNYPDTPNISDNIIHRSLTPPDQEEKFVPSFSTLRALKGTWASSNDAERRKQRGNFLVSRAASSSSNIANNNNS